MAGVSPQEICKRCVMDTTDKTITFDNQGYCNHCSTVEKKVKGKLWFPHNGEEKINEMIRKIKDDGKNKPYDCLIGLSGGVDSSYLAYLVVKKFNLRPLALHVDAGWNSEIAVRNIENIVKNLKIDFHTEVIDWEEVKDLQRSYIKAGVSNQDVPQDHAFFTVLLRMTREKKIGYFLSGGNYATESILPSTWGYNALDSTNLLAIQKQHGTRPLKKYPLLSFIELIRIFYLKSNFLSVNHLETIRPLNYLPYHREEAIKIIEKEMGWTNYGEKHHESVWTKWFQNYYLPTRFGFDKRKAHLSSMIISGEITREQALLELTKPLYDENRLRLDTKFIIKKLGFNIEEFEEFFFQPLREYTYYKNQKTIFDKARKIKRLIFNYK